MTILAAACCCEEDVSGCPACPIDCSRCPTLSFGLQIHVTTPWGADCQLGYSGAMIQCTDFCVFNGPEMPPSGVQFPCGANAFVQLIEMGQPCGFGQPEHSGPFIRCVAGDDIGGTAKGYDPNLAYWVATFGFNVFGTGPNQGNVTFRLAGWTTPVVPGDGGECSAACPSSGVWSSLPIGTIISGGLTQVSITGTLSVGS